MATATATSTIVEKPGAIVAERIYSAALVASMSIWLLAIRVFSAGRNPSYWPQSNLRQLHRTGALS
jgi:hypothetical protein